MRAEAWAKYLPHALHVLGQYASSGEGYLFLAGDDALRFVASLDERTPPDWLEAALSRLPANDTRVSSTVDLPGTEQPQRYNVYPLRVGDARVGLVVLRDTEGTTPEMPSSLLTEISQALGEGAPR